MQVSVFLVPDRWKVSWQYPPPLFSLQRQKSPSAFFSLSLSLDPSYLSLSPVWLEFITRFIGGAIETEIIRLPPSPQSTLPPPPAQSASHAWKEGRGEKPRFLAGGEGDSEEKEGEAEGIFIGAEGPTDRRRVS